MKKTIPDKIKLEVDISCFVSTADSFGTTIHGITTLFEDSATDLFDFDFHESSVTLTIPDFFVPYFRLNGFES